MTEAEFRKLALGMPGATEGEHMEHPDFRAGAPPKIFATLRYPEKGWGMVRLSAEDQAELVEKHAGVFVPAKGAWGRAGATCVLLKRVAKGVLRDAMARAWRRVAE